MPNRIDSNLVDYSSTTKFDRLVAVSTEGGAEIPCGAAWIATRLKPTSDLAASLCDVDDAGFAKVDEHGRTNKKEGSEHHHCCFYDYLVYFPSFSKVSV